MIEVENTMFIKFTIAMMFVSLWLFVSMNNPETAGSEPVLESIPIVNEMQTNSN